MQHFAILRLLLAGFFLYVAWPVIPSAVSTEAFLFWGAWLVFFILVVGANFAALLQMTEPPVMEQERVNERQQA
ncbi:hypothetical protein GCM10007063_19040 [Lentibacillus kapialis]|uniref:Uncharacterized protein n=1 Tax=Lentibacillus kapialis TaxID=340214 RepID=A0A917UYI3_9BACI|nr:hypothetical protein [Lentibacillus kapialis]GGJ96783.1 hypothetical protein GCM10007063_19040 [Lentibacillus kapialis]